MLYGQRIQQNERERRLRKSQLYREMLDNQIRLNSEYRSTHLDPNPPKHTHTHHFFQPTPPIDKQPPEPLETSYIFKLQKEQASASRLLPVLKDSNKFMRGVSRFVKVEEPSRLKHRVEHVHTELIEEEDYDQYDEVCEKIIRDLQDIKNKPVKSRHRRKIYDLSEMQNRRHRLHTEPYLQNTPQLQESNNKSATANYQSTRQPESRYPKFLPQSKMERQQQNEFTMVSLGEQSKTKKQLPALNQSNSQDSTNNFSRGQNGRNKPTRNGNSHLGSYESTIQQSSIDRVKQSKVESEAKKERVMQNRGRKNNNSISYAPNEVQKKQEGELSRASAANLQLQRQNFLQLLRKVKNRGQSLCLKLAKFPNEKPTSKQ